MRTSSFNFCLRMSRTCISTLSCCCCVTDDSTDPFWPALHCFMVILDQLGSKVWGQLIDPVQAFQTIINSVSYNNEIKNIRSSFRRSVLVSAAGICAGGGRWQLKKYHISNLKQRKAEVSLLKL